MLTVCLSEQVVQRQRSAEAESAQVQERTPVDKMGMAQHLSVTAAAGPPAIHAWLGLFKAVLSGWQMGLAAQA